MLCHFFLGNTLFKFLSVYLQVQIYAKLGLFREQGLENLTYEVQVDN